MKGRNRGIDLKAIRINFIKEIVRGTSLTKKLVRFYRYIVVL